MSSETERYAAAARETVEHLEALGETIKAAGPSCKKCKFGTIGEFSFQRKCRHPFVRRGTFDPPSGKTTWQYENYNDIRKRGALCEPEGKLFERPSLAVVVWRMIRTYWTLSFLLALILFFAAEFWLLNYY